MEELKGCPNPECGAGAENIEIHNYVRLDGSHYFKCNCNKCGTTSSFWMNKTLIAKEWNELQVHIPIKKIHCGNCGESDYSFYLSDDNQFIIQCNCCPQSSSTFAEARLRDTKKILIKDFEDCNYRGFFKKIDIDELIKEEEANDN